MELKEYLREFMLMNRQYGREEELYPLIHQLLRESDMTKSLSVRTVANANKKPENVRFSYYGYGSYPDLVILDEEYNLNKEDLNKKDPIIKKENLDKVYGCVEAKKWYGNEFIKPYNEKKTGLYQSEFNVEVYQADLAEISYENAKRIIYYTQCNCNNKELLEKYEKFVPVEDNDIDNAFQAIGIEKKKGNERNIWELIDYKNNKKESITSDEIKDKGKSKTGEIRNVTLKILKEELVLLMTPNDASVDYLCEINSKYITQLICELIWYGKVLYTNGLTWTYLEIPSEKKEQLRDFLYKKCVIGELETVKDKNGKEEEKIKVDTWYKVLAPEEEHRCININCIDIGNMEDIYINEDYKKCKTTKDIEKLVDNHKKWIEEWNRLTKNLSLIDWKNNNDFSKFEIKA